MSPLISTISRYEVSDTVRVPGKSKATLVLQKTKEFQRAIFFALLNPQPDGACFAGMKLAGNFDLSSSIGLEIRMRSQAQNLNQWKIVLSTSATSDRFSSYEQVFEVENGADFDSALLFFADFHQYINGTVRPDEITLDTKDITSIGIQAFGGVYEDFKQFGPATLELDYIKLMP